MAETIVEEADIESVEQRVNRQQHQDQNRRNQQPEAQPAVLADARPERITRGFDARDLPCENIRCGHESTPERGRSLERPHRAVMNWQWVDNTPNQSADR